MKIYVLKNFLIYEKERKISLKKGKLGLTKLWSKNAWLKGLFFFFPAMLRGLWELSSLTRDQTWALGSESVES